MWLQMTSEEQAGLGEKGCEPKVRRHEPVVRYPSLSSDQRSIAHLSSEMSMARRIGPARWARHLSHSPQDAPTFSSVRFFIDFCWVIVALQCCVCFRRTAE